MKKGRPLNEALAEKKKRRCLRCDREFLSQGPWNRLCRDCREYAKKHTYEEYLPQTEEKTWL